MEDPVIQFIRDRFNTLEQSMATGFEEVKTNMNDNHTTQNKRITTLENEKHERKGAMTAWGVVCTAVASIFAWVIEGVK